MKIAYCISGQPRFFEKGYESMFLKFIENNKEHSTDVFIHTWHNPDLVNQQYDSSEWNVGISDTYKENTIDNICKLYKPKKILVERPIDFKIKQQYDTNKAKQPTNITFSMFNSIYKSNELKKQAEAEELFKYDFVIRSRFDWFLKEQINIEDLDRNTLYIPNRCPTENAYNDQFAIGSSKDMDIYCDTYNNIEAHWYFDKIMLSNESLLYHQLHKNKVTNIIELTNEFDFIRK